MLTTYGDPQHQIRLVLSRCWGHWIAISLNSRSFCCCQHHNTNLIDGPSDDAVKRGRGFGFKLVGGLRPVSRWSRLPLNLCAFTKKSVLNVLWCWTLGMLRNWS